METNYSLPPSEETEIRDDMSTRTIPRSETTYLPSLNRSPAMSDVAPQSSAVADLTHELERQISVAEYEKRNKNSDRLVNWKLLDKRLHLCYIQQHSY